MSVLLWIFGVLFFIAFVVCPIVGMIYFVVRFMNKKERKVYTRHDRHVLHGGLKVIIDTNLSPEKEEELYEKEERNQVRKEKRSR